MNVRTGKFEWNYIIRILCKYYCMCRCQTRSAKIQADIGIPCQSWIPCYFLLLHYCKIRDEPWFMYHLLRCCTGDGYTALGDLLLVLIWLKFYIPSACLVVPAIWTASCITTSGLGNCWRFPIVPWTFWISTVSLQMASCKGKWHTILEAGFCSRW